MITEKLRAPERAPIGCARKNRWPALLSSLCLLAAASLGQADVREVFRCSFIDGADMDDLMKARDYLVQQSEKLGLTDMTAFVWTPYKVDGFNDDFLWFSTHADMAAFAKAGDTYAKSPEGQAVQARFDKIVECNTSMSTREQIYTGSEEMTITPPALIASFACKLNHGQNMGHVQDLISHYKGVLDASGMHEQFIAFMDVPVMSSTDNDLYVYGVHPDLATWAARGAAMQSSEAGQMLGRHAQQVMDCNNALWWGQRVVPPM